MYKDVGNESGRILFARQRKVSDLLRQCLPWKGGGDALLLLEYGTVARIGVFYFGQLGRDKIEQREHQRYICVSICRWNQEGWTQKIHVCVCRKRRRVVLEETQELARAKERGLDPEAVLTSVDF